MVNPVGWSDVKMVNHKATFTDFTYFDFLGVTWLANGQMIKQSKYFDMKSSGDKHTLTIAEAFPEDEGEYMITAKNSAGEVSCTATLHVRNSIQ